MIKRDINILLFKDLRVTHTIKVTEQKMALPCNKSYTSIRNNVTVN